MQHVFSTRTLGPTALLRNPRCWTDITSCADHTGDCRTHDWSRTRWQANVVCLQIEEEMVRRRRDRYARNVMSEAMLKQMRAAIQRGYGQYGLKPDPWAGVECGTNAQVRTQTLSHVYIKSHIHSSANA